MEGERCDPGAVRAAGAGGGEGKPIGAASCRPSPTTRSSSRSSTERRTAPSRLRASPTPPGRGSGGAAEKGPDHLLGSARLQAGGGSWLPFSARTSRSRWTTPWRRWRRRSLASGTPRRTASSPPATSSPARRAPSGGSAPKPPITCGGGGSSRVSARDGAAPSAPDSGASAAYNLAVSAPSMAAEWHPTKNGKLTPHDVTLGSGKIVWWKCPEGPEHEWRCAVGSRLKQGCPFCANMRVSSTNSLAAVAPGVAAR